MTNEITQCMKSLKCNGHYQCLMSPFVDIIMGSPSLHQ